MVPSLKRSRAAEGLTTLVEGESLFNDAGALVLFAGILGFAVNLDAQLDQAYVGLFLLAFFGRLALGVGIGLLGLMIGGLHRFAYSPREAGPLQLDICCVLGQFSGVFEPEFLKQADAISANCLNTNS